MIDIQKIARTLIDDLETKSILHKVRAEGVKMLHDTIMEAAKNAQEALKKAEEEASGKQPGDKVPSNKSKRPKKSKAAENAN